MQPATIADGEDADSVEEISGGFEDSVIGGEDLDQKVFEGMQETESKEWENEDAGMGKEEEESKKGKKNPDESQEKVGEEEKKQPKEEEVVQKSVEIPEIQEGPGEILRYAILRR